MSDDLGDKSNERRGFLKRVAAVDKNLDAFLSDPQKLVPGNVMPFSGVADAKQRADLIAYLKTVK